MENLACSEVIARRRKPEKYATRTRGCQPVRVAF